jgi:hypothetical protein
MDLSDTGKFYCLICGECRIELVYDDDGDYVGKVTVHNEGFQHPDGWTFDEEDRPQ